MHVLVLHSLSFWRIGMVEVWLQKLVDGMQGTVKSTIKRAYRNVQEMALEDFIFGHPAQIALLGIQFQWTADTQVWPLHSSFLCGFKTQAINMHCPLTSSYCSCCFSCLRHADHHDFWHELSPQLQLGQNMAMLHGVYFCAVCFDSSKDRQGYHV